MSELAKIALSPDAKEEIESLLVSVVPMLADLEELLTVDLEAVEDFEAMRYDLTIALGDITHAIDSADKKLRALTPKPTYTGPKTAVSLRAVMARVNRKLQPYSRLIISRSKGDFEKKFGKFQVLDGNYITNAFNHVAVLEDYAREIGVLKPHETVAA